MGGSGRSLLSGAAYFVYTRPMADDDHVDQELTQLLRQEGVLGGESRPAITPMAAAGAGLAGAVAGAAIMVLWSPWTQPQPAVVSVTSCSDQYVTITDTLSEMVSEGIEAGQAPKPEVSWINSINTRLGMIDDQLERLQLECVDGAEAG